MKYDRWKRLLAVLTFVLVLIVMLTGCGGTPSSENQGEDFLTEEYTDSTGISSAFTDTASPSPNALPLENAEASEQRAKATELEVRFGDEGVPFIMHLQDNDTAAAIAEYVGTADWRLPIYNFDNYENWEVMQYYDLPDRYEIPSHPERIESEQGGTVYYSEPNRIVLFFRDAEISGEFTAIGYFDVSEAIAEAVEQNPILEGWGNKIIRISPIQ